MNRLTAGYRSRVTGRTEVFLGAAGEQDTYVGQDWVSIVVPDMSGIKLNLQLFG